MSAPPRFYGVDVTDELETICEATVRDDGLIEMAFVFLELPPPPPPRERGTPPMTFHELAVEWSIASDGSGEVTALLCSCKNWDASYNDVPDGPPSKQLVAAARLFATHVRKAASRERNPAE